MEYKSVIGWSGINRDVSTFLNTDGEYREAQNVVTNKIGTIKKSGDYEIRGAQISAGYDILGGVDWLRADGTHTHLAAVDAVALSTDADIYEFDSIVWNAASQSLTAGYKVRFGQSQALDNLFAVNYADATRSYDGSTWSTSTNVTDCPKAKFVIEFGSRIYVLNCLVGATAYPTRAYRSSLVDTAPITWDTARDWFTFEDVITGVGKSGENMLVGCQDSVRILTLDDEIYRISNHGCASHESITNYGTISLWASYDGMYMYDGGEERKISSPIQDYWDAIQDHNAIRAAVKGHHLYIYIEEITLDGVNLGYSIFDYDILRDDWNRLNFGKDVKYLQLVSETTNIAGLSGPEDPINSPDLYFGDDDGTIYKLFSSSSQNTTAFSSFVETSWFNGSDPKYKDTFYELWGYGNRLSGIKVSYKLDNEDNDWVSAGEFNGSIACVNYKAHANRIKFLLEEYSKDNMWELERLDIGFKSAYMPKKLEEK